MRFEYDKCARLGFFRIHAHFAKHGKSRAQGPQSQGGEWRHISLCATRRNTAQHKTRPSPKHVSWLLPLAPICSLSWLERMAKGKPPWRTMTCLGKQLRVTLLFEYITWPR